MLCLNKLVRLMPMILLVLIEILTLSLLFLPLIKRVNGQEVFFVGQGKIKTDFLISQENMLISLNSFHSYSQQKSSEAAQKINVVVTGYSSTIEETDNTPFLTAANTLVKEGIVANNLYPFGTKIKFPKLFGERIFVVEDRMHSRKGNYIVDIWFPSREDALNFGVKFTEMEVL